MKTTQINTPRNPQQATGISQTQRKDRLRPWSNGYDRSLPCFGSEFDSRRAHVFYFWSFDALFTYAVPRRSHGVPWAWRETIRNPRIVFFLAETILMRFKPKGSFLKRSFRSKKCFFSTNTCQIFGALFTTRCFASVCLEKALGTPWERKQRRCARARR